MILLLMLFCPMIFSALSYSPSGIWLSNHKNPDGFYRLALSNLMCQRLNPKSGFSPLLQGLNQIQKSTSPSKLSASFCWLISWLLWLSIDSTLLGYFNYIFDLLTFNLLSYSFSITFALDNLSILMLLLTSFTYLILIFNTSAHLRSPIRLSIFLVILCFTLSDLLLFYIALELSVLPLFFIVNSAALSKPYRSAKIHRANLKLISFTLLGSLLFLIPLLTLFITAGSTSYRLLSQLSYSLFDIHTLILLSLFIFFCFGVKVPIIPFHTWLPEARAESPTRGSILLAAVILKLSGYALIRFLSDLFPHVLTADFFYLVSTTILIFGSLFSSIIAIRQTDLKKYIAYTSVARINLTILGLLTPNSSALYGSILLMLAHGLVSSGLFFLAGSLIDRFSVRGIKYYTGLIISIPLFSGAFTLLNLANIGLPLTANFAGELLIFQGLFDSNLLLALLASLSILFAGFYGFWLATRTTLGPASLIPLPPSPDLSRLELFFILFILSFTFLLGFYPIVL